MADSDKDEVFDSESDLDFSNQKELEQAFDNLLNDSHILTQKYAHLKEQLFDAQKENEKFKMNNEILFYKTLFAGISFQVF